MKLYKNNFTLDGKKHVLVTINQNESEVKTEKKSVDQIHHIHILDRSGSMASYINDLIDDVQKSFDCIGEDDFISIIWFSSQSDYKTLVKGAKKSDNLKDLMDSIRFTRNLTCFSDPIAEAAKIVEELKPMCSNFSITLFTDGVPCGVDMFTERKEVTASLVAMQKDVMAFNTIGYGHYCDEEFLKFMTEYSEFGQFVHSDNIKDYSEIFKTNFEKISESVVEKVTIQTSCPIFYLNRKMTKMFQAPKINFNRLSKDKNQFFILGEEKDFTFQYNNISVDTKEIKESVNEVTFDNFCYAMAYNLFQAGLRNKSMLVYGKLLMDKEAVDRIQNCFTISEIEEVRKLLEKMVVDNSSRYQNGKCPNNYIPRKDAHCVMDVLNELSLTKSYFVPFHKESDKYERITRKNEDTGKTFIRNDDLVYSPFEDFTFNKTKLNMSIQVSIDGFVDIDKADNLPFSTVDCKMFRNYTILKDGNLNMKSMVVLVSEDTFESLKKKGTDIKRIQANSKQEMAIIPFLRGSCSEPYTFAKITFGKLPLINRLYLDESLEAKKLLNSSMELSILEAKQAMLNYHLKQIKEENPIAEKEGMFQKLTKEQIELMKTKYFVDSHGWYRPPYGAKKTSECDSYRTRELEFVFKGLSKLPSVEDYFTKTRSKMTIGFTLLDVAYTWLKDVVLKAGIDIEKKNFALRDFLKFLLKETKQALLCIRSDVAKMKLAIVLNSDDIRGLETDDKGNRFVKGKEDELLYVKTDIAWEHV